MRSSPKLFRPRPQLVNLGFPRHGSEDSESALISLVLSEREWNERARLSCSTERSKGTDADRAVAVKRSTPERDRIALTTVERQRGDRGVDS
jgi:hypothetical protein